MCFRVERDTAHYTPASPPTLPPAPLGTSPSSSPCPLWDQSGAPPPPPPPSFVGGHGLVSIAPVAGASPPNSRSALATATL